MADFSSALYLGLRHPAWALAPWSALTLGRPAALQEPPGAAALAAQLAALQGCQAATLQVSTMQLFWDLFGMLAAEPLALLVDGGAYPIARWGAERAVARGLPQQVFRHGAVDAAAALARQWSRRGRRPLILADGYSPGTAGAPPLARLARIAGEGGGYLVLDDTQALGVLGRAGGGSLRRHGVAGPHVLVGASLAKAFGAPLAVLAGSAELVARFEAHSQTRRHCSPPSLAAIAAGQRALRINRACGDGLRRSLWRVVEQFRRALAARGIECRGGQFPVQTVRLAEGVDAAALQAALARDGVEAVAQMTEGGAALSFLLRADHRPQDIEQAVAALEQQLRRQHESAI
ncbi:aminotransferase class I/II-fold pyridoxal phosphate-dependent enzyme [Rugamonas sp. CCM 8940]|uniref:aminotransferase class I/II-fold pyridoxal phosphate-dependent enzyme n=1 Tax=Rugamonas sp. CCM 8940 TaxID=2765359 RepID=UPI0018F5A4F5|nr:aminotransferase class I/II-fold pyridoxal phosphate-dependent enzyme [Rugamonas sp. CCM 8940]MBJ7309185.1 aminotransferase class I/II-fold pyridoxal phosphate-dependent enzyme [Rugamonas sp. CCM 8940]